ncbi:MAG TPA: ParB/RepB/Spo0J family partition protein [Woeseiaceae bacterium]
MNRKKRLGRGLDALLSRSTVAPAEPEAAAAGPAAAPAPAPAASGGAPAEVLRRVPVELLKRGRYQPRVDMREESLAELADSIRTQGVVQPIVVRPIGSGDGREERYEIIAGERRWRAAQMAGLAEIPAVIRDVPDEAAIAMALIENIQRENLNPLEEARALDRLIREFELTHEEAAEAVGRSRAAVSNLLRLLELPESVKELVETRALDMGHARALLALAEPGQRVAAAREVVKQGLSVRATEALVRRLQGKPAKAARAAPAPDADVRRLETELADKLGARVHIEHGAKGSGTIVIAYHSLEELDGILAHIR